MNTLPEETQTVHAGPDIAKAALHLHLQGRQRVLPNTTSGHAQLVKLLRALPGVHVVCEATGGYERTVVAALHVAAIPVSVVNPARVRHFAQGGQEPLPVFIIQKDGFTAIPTIHHMVNRAFIFHA